MSDVTAITSAAANWFPEQVELFRKLIQNVVNSPTDAKFRRLKLSNARIGALLQTDGTRTAFESLGWVLTAEGDALELPTTADLGIFAAALKATEPQGDEVAGGAPWEVTVLRGPLRSKLQLTSAATIRGLNAAIEKCDALGKIPRARQKLLCGYPPKLVQEQRADGSLATLEELNLKTVMLEDLWEELVGDLRACRATYRQLWEALRRPALATVALRDSKDFLLDRIKALLKERLTDVPLEEVKAARSCFRLLSGTPPGDPATAEERIKVCATCAKEAVDGGRPRRVRPPPTGFLAEVLAQAEAEGMEIEDPDDPGPPPKTLITVDRNDVFGSTVLKVSEMPVEELRRPLEVQFAGEAAEDAGGLRREFFNEFGRACASADGLWQLTPAGNLAPAPDKVSARKIPDSQQRQAMFRGCGRVFGMALCQAALPPQQPLLLGLPLARSFVSLLQGDTAETLDELQAALNAEQKEGVPDFRGSRDMRQRSLDELGLTGQLTFSTQLVDGEIVDLEPDGRNVQVTDANKEAWLKSVLRYELIGGIEEAATAFRSGVADLAGASHLVLLSAKELQLAWSGQGEVTDKDLETWLKFTEVSASRKQQAEWLFEMLRTGDLRAARGKLLKFATGSDRWPVDPKGFKFVIEPMDGGDTALPCAMTCGNMLQLPSFSGPMQLRDKLLQALELGKDVQMT
eukprot:TRINITY_DN27113_c0_g1_i1.p1 TRINITY_DN27113_c0_g1~~TRINITY_DN27113_c0_g1_i1.p1  ORF type:complete len:689 (-),score=157.58 TRINITY_DN27113_c0_g1_i1:336-2402(-)